MLALRIVHTLRVAHPHHSTLEFAAALATACCAVLGFGHRVAHTRSSKPPRGLIWGPAVGVATAGVLMFCYELSNGNDLRTAAGAFLGGSLWGALPGATIGGALGALADRVVTGDGALATSARVQAMVALSSVILGGLVTDSTWRTERVLLASLGLAWTVIALYGGPAAGTRESPQSDEPRRP